MRRLMLIAAFARLARAEPATKERFDDCVTRRAELHARAIAQTDTNARGELLAAMPSCHRGEDGTYDVTDGVPLPVPENTPYARYRVALGVGAAFSSIMSNEVQPSGTGPYVEIEASYRPLRRVSLAVMAGYTSFHDPMVHDPLNGQTYDVREVSYDVLARLHVHYGEFLFGGGLGLEYESYAVSKYTATLPCAEVHADYTLARTRGIAVHVLAVVTGVRGIDDASDMGADLVSARLGVGLAY